MTVTQKKRKYSNQYLTISDYGQKYHCDSCSCDISGLIRIKCASCVDYDLCLECFAAGVETLDHKRDHPYRVIEMLDFPIYEIDWHADQELLLIEGLEMYGMGNWEQISEHIGSKLKTEVADHYNRIFVKSDLWPLPVSSYTFDKSSRRSITGMELEIKKPLKIARPPASQPSNHDIQGFMPGRLEFEVEFDNEAEQHIGAIEFFDTDTPEEVELKTAMLDIYNTTLSRRLDRKNYISNREITDFRKVQAIEKKKSKDEKDLVSKIRVFNRMISESDFNIFSQGILNESKLRLRINQLQEARRMGISKISEITAYEKDKVNRASNRVLGYSNSTPRLGTSRIKSEDVSLNSSPRTGHHHSSRKSSYSLDVSQLESVKLLSPEEKEICSILRIYPKAYLSIKDILIREYATVGSLKLEHAKSILRIDSSKTDRLYEFFYENGWIKTI